MEESARDSSVLSGHGEKTSPGFNGSPWQPRPIPASQRFVVCVSSLGHDFSFFFFYKYCILTWKEGFELHCVNAFFFFFLLSVHLINSIKQDQKHSLFFHFPSLKCLFQCTLIEKQIKAHIVTRL